MPETRAVVVTGASRGIGRAVVRFLDERGYRVFAGIRHAPDAAALTAEGSGRITPIRIDVTDAGSLAAARASVEGALGTTGLHALVNNAGVVMAGPLEGISAADVRHQFDVNVVGVLQATQAFLPLIRRGHGRVVNVSSVSGRVATRFVGAYAASKFALEALSDALRLELRYWRIPVVLVEPGAVATDIWETSRTRAVNVWQEAPPEVRKLYERVIQRMAERTKPPSRAIPAQRVARTIGRAVAAASPRARYTVGWDARLGILLAAMLPTPLMDRLLTR